MTMTEITPRERLEEAVDAYEAAEQDFARKGAAVGPEDEANVKALHEDMQRAWGAFERSQDGKNYLTQLRAGANPTNVMDDGRTFDDLASASGIVNPTAGMSIGEAFAASDAYKEMLAKHLRNDGTLAPSIGRSQSVDFAVSLANFLRPQNALRFDGEGARNTLVTALSPSGGQVFIQPQILPGVTDLAPLRQTRIVDIMTRVPLTTDSMEWHMVATKTNNAAFVPEAISAAPIVAGVPTNADAGIKPESGMTFSEASAKVETIAHWMPYTRRVAADAPQLIQMVNTFLLRGLTVKIEDGLMNGNGTSPQIRGLTNTTLPWNLQVFDISVAGGPTRLDAVALAAAQIFNAGEGEWEPNAILIHPLDWFSGSFLLAKDGQSNYYGPGPWAALGNQAPWGIRPVITKAIPQGTQLLGDFSQFLLGDRQQNTLMFFDQHQDYAIRNLLLSLAEARLTCGVRVPQAFIQIVA